jgi:hypothetical protein
MTELCKYCGAPPIFKKGDRVALNTEWKKASGGEMKPLIGSKATVRKAGTATGCVWVLFDDQKIAKLFHQSFFRRIR